MGLNIHINFLKSKKFFLFAGILLSLFILGLTVTYQQQQISLRSKAAPLSRQSLEGEYLLMHAHEGELETGVSVFDSYLKKDDGSMVTLAFSVGAPSKIVPGSRIRVNGISKGANVFEVAPNPQLPSLPSVKREEIIEQLGGNDIQVIQSKSKVLGATTTKTIKLAVILVNFANLQTQPYDKSQIIREASTNTDSVEKYMEENAYGAIDVQTDVLGYYTLNNNVGAGKGCVGNDQEIYNKVKAAGVNIDSYQQIIISWPAIEGCSGAYITGGWSDMGRVAHIVLPNYTGQANRWRNYGIHELAHNFGTRHAGNVSCVSGGVRVAMSNSCTSDEPHRADPYGAMGNGPGLTTHLNISNKLEAGFLSSSQVQTVSSNGTYSLAPLAAPMGGNKGLKVTTSGAPYFVEFRQPYGTFENFSSIDNVTSGVLIRRKMVNGFNAWTDIIDNTPETLPSAPNALNSFKDSALLVGKVFYDPVNKISIETLSVSPNGASVKITFNASHSVTAAPTLSPTASAPTPTRVPTKAPTSTPAPTKAPTVAPTVAPTRIPTPTKTPTPPSTNASVKTPTPTKRPTPTPTFTPKSSDKTPPTAPTQLVGFAVSQKINYLVWTGSTDNKGVIGYHIARDNVRIGTIRTSYPRAYFIDTNIISGRRYTYKVQAFDAAGNLSGFSNSVVVTAK